ncbi:MAG: DUF5659 domain-containing protein [Dehalococcoidales bacterium]
MLNYGMDVSTIEDANIVAYLKMKGFKATPFIKNGKQKNSRVAWNIEGDISKAVAQYYEDIEVDVYSFVKMLKDVRAEMYNLKQANKN